MAIGGQIHLHALGAHIPIAHATAISQFLDNFSPKWPLNFFVQRDSPNNQAQVPVPSNDLYVSSRFQQPLMSHVNNTNMRHELNELSRPLVMPQPE